MEVSSETKCVERKSVKRTLDDAQPNTSSGPRFFAINMNDSSDIIPLQPLFQHAEAPADPGNLQLIRVPASDKIYLRRPAKNNIAGESEDFTKMNFKVQLPSKGNDLVTSTLGVQINNGYQATTGASTLSGGIESTSSGVSTSVTDNSSGACMEIWKYYNCFHNEPESSCSGAKNKANSGAKKHVITSTITSSNISETPPSSRVNTSITGANTSNTSYSALMKPPTTTKIKRARKTKHIVKTTESINTISGPSTSGANITSKTYNYIADHNADRSKSWTGCNPTEEVKIAVKEGLKTTLRAHLKPEIVSKLYRGVCEIVMLNQIYDERVLNCPHEAKLTNDYMRRCVCQFIETCKLMNYYN